MRVRRLIMEAYNQNPRGLRRYYSLFNFRPYILAVITTYQQNLPKTGLFIDDITRIAGN